MLHLKSFHEELHLINLKFIHYTIILKATKYENYQKLYVYKSYSYFVLQCFNVRGDDKSLFHQQSFISGFKKYNKI